MASRVSIGSLLLTRHYFDGIYHIGVDAIESGEHYWALQLHAKNPECDLSEVIDFTVARKADSTPVDVVAEIDEIIQTTLFPRPKPRTRPSASRKRQRPDTASTGAPEAEEAVSDHADEPAAEAEEPAAMAEEVEA